MASKRYASVNIKSCVSCGACMRECPRDAIRVMRGCFAVVDKAVCVGCGICQRTCPAGCIDMIQREETL